MHQHAAQIEVLRKELYANTGRLGETARSSPFVLWVLCNFHALGYMQSRAEWYCQLGRCPSIAVIHSIRGLVIMCDVIWPEFKAEHSFFPKQGVTQLC